jgi:putative spermidine/putrescine transport system permease protein
MVGQEHRGRDGTAECLARKLTRYHRSTKNVVAFHRFGAAALLAPGLVVLGAFFVAPIAALLALSFTANGGAEVNYSRFLSQPVYLQVLQRTLVMGAATAFICLLLGYPVAYRLANAGPRGRALLLAFILIPFWTNLLVRSYGWLVLLNPKGILNRYLVDWGLVGEPLNLVHNSTGALIGMVQIMLPYLILPLAATMMRVNAEQLRAARSLGARPLAVFLYVYFPLTLPGVMAGLVLVFTVSLGFFVIPAILGGTRDIFLAQLIEFNINYSLNWGFAGALSLLLVATTLALFWAGDRWFGLRAVWGVR